MHLRYCQYLVAGLVQQQKDVEIQTLSELLEKGDITFWASMYFLGSYDKDHNATV